MPEKINTNLNFGEDSIDPFDQTDENLWVKMEHLGRYLFAADYLRQFKLTCVADIACGVGYGIRELEKIADLVIGVDGNSDLLKKAEQQCNNSQTKLILHNLDQPGLLVDKTYPNVDAIVSFETLEHLINPTRMLEQFSQLLLPGGLLTRWIAHLLGS